MVRHQRQAGVDAMVADVAGQIDHLAVGGGLAGGKACRVEDEGQFGPVALGKMLRMSRLA